MDRLRSYPDPMAQRHLSNEIDGEAVKTMMAVAEKNYGFAHDYFRLKAKLLELPRSSRSTTNTRPSAKKSRPFPYASSAEVILNAFEAFDPNVSATSPENFLPKIGSTPRSAKANAAAPSALRLRRSSIPISCATTTTTCATS